MCHAAEDYQQKINKDGGGADTASSASSQQTQPHQQQNKRGVNDYELHLQGEAAPET